MRRGVDGLLGLGCGQGRGAEEGRAGVGVVMKVAPEKKAFSISEFSFRENSFVGETLGGDLVGLGYGMGRGAEAGRAGVTVAVGVGNRDNTRVDAMIESMSGVVQGLRLLLQERLG